MTRPLQVTFAAPPMLGPRLLLLGCGKAKAPGPCPAEELYTGSLFRSRLAYARASGCEWQILSAAYGLVPPGTVLASYDTTLRDLAEVDRAAWALRVVGQILDAQADEVRLSRLRVEIHAGADYAEPVRDVLRAIGVREVLLPLEGCGIGVQRGWYAKHAASLAHRAGP